MNLTLSLAINGDGTGTTTKKRKLRDSIVVDDDDGGDQSNRVMMRLLQASSRERTKITKLVETEDDDDDDVSNSGLRLMHLLLASVSLSDSGDARAAAAALREVRRRASFRGADPAQRVAAHFAGALMMASSSRSRSSRLVVRSSPPPPSPTSAEQFLAYTMFYQASPIYQLAHFTANQAILEAFDENTAGVGAQRRRRRLHVVDFDVSYGFQWPSLIQSLSAAATAAAASTSTSATTSNNSSSHDDDERSPAAVSLRITGFGRSADELRRTEARLARFATGCANLRFEFEGIVVHDVDDDDSSDRHRHDERMVKVDDDATVVVNLVFPAAQRSSSALLARIRSLNPSLVFLVEKHGVDDVDGGGRNACLLPAFTARLRYFAAVFDSLHECFPADSAERLAIERNHLGVEITDAMASLLDSSNDNSYGDRSSMMMAAEPNKPSRSWKETMECAGFEGVELSSRTVSQAKLLLKMKSGGGGGSGGGGFRVVVEGEEGEGGRALSLGWRDCAQLITATGWRRRRRSRSIN